MKLKKSYFEYSFLAIFILIFLWLGIGSLFDHRLSHDFPYGYLASDAFLHLTVAEGIKTQGDFKTFPYYAVAGAKDVVGFNPPLFKQDVAAFSYLAGIESYDAIYLLIFVSLLFSVLVLYTILRDFTKNIALLMLPLTILVFTKNFYAGVTWGQWDFYPGVMFLVAIAWCFSKIDLKGIVLPLGLLLSATLLTHPPETFWAAGFILFYFTYKLITKNFKLEELKNVIYGVVIAVILSFYFIPIFQGVWSERLTLKLQEMPESAGFPIVGITDFSWLLIFIVFGILISLFFYKKIDTSILFSLYLLLAGYTIYLGFDKSLQLRFNWPIFLAPLFGLTLYQIFKFFIKDWKIYYSIGLSVVFFIVFILIFYKPLSTQGLMDSEHWQALMWLRDNTGGDARVYYFYGDIYSQKAVLYSAKRTPYLVDTNDYVAALKNQTINRYYLSDNPGQAGGYPYRVSFWEFKKHILEPEYERTKQRDVCNFDYYVFDKVSQVPILTQYNIIIMSKFLEKDWIKEVYNNQIVTILKNDNPGADCLV